MGLADEVAKGAEISAGVRFGHGGTVAAQEQGKQAAAVWASTQL